MSTVRALGIADAAYIAGIVDGEGTVTLSRLHRNEQRRIVVSVSNNERALLEYIRQAVGAGRISNKRTYGARHAPSFHYQISSRQALDLLRQITPYLRTYKAIRARMALATYLEVTPRNGKYTPEMLGRRQSFEDTFLSVKPRTEDSPTREAGNSQTSVTAPHPVSKHVARIEPQA